MSHLSISSSLVGADEGSKAGNVLWQQLELHLRNYNDERARKGEREGGSRDPLPLLSSSCYVLQCSNSPTNAALSVKRDKETGEEGEAGAHHQRYQMQTANNAAAASTSALALLL